MIYVFTALCQEVCHSKEARKKSFQVDICIYHMISAKPKVTIFHSLKDASTSAHFTNSDSNTTGSKSECITLNSDNHSSTTPVSTANIFQHLLQNLQPERISKHSL